MAIRIFTGPPASGKTQAVRHPVRGVVIVRLERVEAPKAAR